MPIRDDDRLTTPRNDVFVIGNRGVNGIDGSISTVIGYATTGNPTTALIGDIDALSELARLRLTTASNRRDQQRQRRHLLILPRGEIRCHPR